MDFRDSPDEAAFRDRLRGWLTEQKGKFPTSGDEYWAKAGEWHQALYEAGFFGTSWPKEYGGQDLPPVYDVIVDEEIAKAGAPARPEPGLPGRRPEPPRQRGTAAAVSARHDQRHRALVPGILRAGRGFGPGVADDDRDPRRRRVRHPRPQDLDELLRRRRLVPGAGPHRQGCAQAQGHLGVHRVDAPAGNRAAAAEDDQRRHQGVRPGRVRRGAGAGRATWSARPATAGSWR